MSVFRNPVEFINTTGIPTLSSRSDGILYSQSGILKYDNGTSISIVAGAGGPNVNKLDDLADVTANANVGTNALIVFDGTNFNTFVGKSAGGNVTTGSSLILIGEGAGGSMTSANESVAIGYVAGGAVTTGLRNTFLGFRAGAGVTVSSNCVYIGWMSGNSAAGVGGNYNVYIGGNTGTNNSTGTENFGAGDGAGTAITTGSRNTMCGRSAGSYTTIGNDCIYLGSQSGANVGFATLSNQFVVANSSTTQLLRGDLLNQNLILGYSGVAPGNFKTATRSFMMIDGVAPNDDADLGSIILYSESGILKYRGQSGAPIVLNGLVPNLTQTIANTGLGISALEIINSGSGIGNSAFGYQCMMGAIDGSYNSVLGWRAGYSIVNGVRNVLVGYESGLSLDNSAATGDNVFVGAEAGRSMVTGTKNVFMGSYAGYACTSSQNVFIGHNTGLNVTTGSASTYIGYEAGYSCISSSGIVAIGWHSSYSNTGGVGITTVGYRAGELNQGSYNTYLGYGTGQLNISGSQCVYIGYLAGSTNSSGLNNVYVGSNAGLVSTGSDNILVGQNAGLSLSTGSNNVYVGKETGKYLTIQNTNVFVGNMICSDLNCISANSVIVGNSAGLVLTTGTNSVLIGNNCGSRLTTGSNNIFIGNDCATDIGFTTTSNQCIISNNTNYQLLRGDLINLNVAYGWSDTIDPNFYSASKSLMLYAGTLPSSDADANQMIMTHSNGKLHLRAQNGDEVVSTKLASAITSMPSNGTYTLFTIPRNTSSCAFMRFFVKNNTITGNFQAGYHTISWNNTGGSVVANISSFGLSPASIPDISFTVTNDGTTNITVSAVITGGIWTISYNMIDNL